MYSINISITLSFIGFLILLRGLNNLIKYLLGLLD